MPSLLNSTFVTIKEQADAILQSPNIHSPNPASIEYIINVTSARIKESLKEEHRKFFDQLGEEIFQRVDAKVNDLLLNTTAAVDTCANEGPNWRKESEQCLTALEIKVGQGLDKINAMLESNSINEMISLKEDMNKHLQEISDYNLARFVDQ